MIQLVKSSVVFNPENHTYFLGDKQLFGVTSTLIRRAFPNKYSGISEETLANAAAKGHELHEKIQNHDRFGGYLDDERIRNYDKVKESYGLTVLANEYTVSDEERYASQIDIVCINPHNEICLVDTKSTYSLDRASTALQLSIYKRFFEKQNPNLKVSHIYALWLPNKDHSICEFIELSPTDNDTLDSLIKADICDEPFVFNPILDEYSFIESEYRKWDTVKKEAEEKIASIKEKLMELMKEKNLTQIKSGLYTVSYIPEKTSRRFDSTAFKKENAELYETYMKDSVTAAQIRFLETKSNLN